ncbi:MAG TPA: hypothetical protein VNH44_16010 [Micropepsaceae bacterium]|nr:hypothetical protein [Micropepsaceae bacterium]
MKSRDPFYWVRFAAVTVASAAITVAALTAVSARAADLSADSLKFAPGVTKAAEGFETPATTYIVANPTSIFSDHSFFGTKVTGKLKRGEHVDALAKVKGYDWVLVGKNGQGLGYVPISMLSPADQYHS